MKKIFSLFTTGGLVFGLILPANAALIDRGRGLIYDDVLNITWLQNANLAGRTMSWADAMAWAEGLVYAGYDDWRLPTADPSCGFSFNCTGSEMGYMYYTNLGLSTYGPLSNTDLFGSSLQPERYWTGTETGPGNKIAMNFYFGNGMQDADEKGAGYYAWAVRSGDVGTPMP